jgi:hypothetical protein
VSARPFRVGDRVKVEGVINQTSESGNVRVSVSGTLVLQWFTPGQCELIPPSFEPGDIVMGPGGAREVATVMADGSVVLTTGWVHDDPSDLVLVCREADRADL